MSDLLDEFSFLHPPYTLRSRISCPELSHKLKMIDARHTPCETGRLVAHP